MKNKIFLITLLFSVAVYFSGCSCSGKGSSTDAGINTGGSSSTGGTTGTTYTPSSGTTDTSFAESGEFLSGSLVNDSARDSVSTSDGSIFIVGYRHNGSNYDALLLKLKSDGTLDTSFNGTGFILRDNIAGGNDYDYAFSIDVASDGDLMVGGYSKNASGKKQIYLWKVSTSGVDDPDFGTGGTFLLSDSYNIGQTFIARYDSLTDNIYIAAACSGTSVWRVKSDGSGLDTTFSDDGYYNIHTSSIQPKLTTNDDGNLIVFSDMNGGAALSWILDTNGTILTEYGNPLAHSGLADNGTGSDKWYAAIPAPDNKLILVGTSISSVTSYDEVIARVNMSDGSLDTTFGGGDGYWTDDVLGLGTIGRVYDAVVQQDGSIIAALEVISEDGDWDAAIIKLDANGERDMTYASGEGIIMLGGDYTDRGPKIFQQPDGRLLVMTSKENEDGTKNLVVWAIQ